MFPMSKKNRVPEQFLTAVNDLLEMTFGKGAVADKEFCAVTDASTDIIDVKTRLGVHFCKAMRNVIKKKFILPFILPNPLIYYDIHGTIFLIYN